MNAAVGSVPMPIVMGVILDRTCSVWSYECGDLAACQLYNDTQLALGIGGLIAGTKVRIFIKYERVFTKIKS